MQNQSLIFENGWKALDHIRRAGDRFTVLNFANALKMIEPNTTYEEYKAIMKKLYGREGRFSDWPFVPKEFEWLVKSFANKTNALKVLVPYATGLEHDCFSDEVNVDYYFFNKEIEQATTLFAQINTLPELPEKRQYDLIVAALPFGPINNKSLACQIAEQSFSLLTDNGHCLFTFPKGITFGMGTKWLEKLEEIGIYCTAIIDMPKGAYAPGTMFDTEIVLFSKIGAAKRFVALLDAEDSSDRIVDNYLNGKVPQNASKLGVLIDKKDRCYSVYKEGLRAQKLIERLEKAYNGKRRKLSEFSIAKAPDKDNEFQDNENAVYIPKLGNSRVVTEIEDFQIKAQNYFQLIVDPEIMLPRFLAFLMNTEDGLALRQYHYTGTTIKAFGKGTVVEMAVPCPSIELQSEYLKTFDQLEALRVEVEDLKTKLLKVPASYTNIRKEIKDINNTGDRFAQWIETLPYPLATILKRYSVVEDARTSQDLLLYFFEAYSIFEATILSAALDKNLIDCSNLTMVNSSMFEKASFGNWVRMDRALANLFLSAINGNDKDKRIAAMECFKTKDENIIRLLCNKNVSSILENAGNKRNDWKGHSGIASDVVCREHADVLNSMLLKFQESIKDVYERVRLVRCLSSVLTDGMFNNSVENLTGSNSIFKKDTIVSDRALDTSKLYLQILDTEEFLELPPFFILKKSPADVKNACYFYSKVEKGNTKYVSYHYDGKPEDTESGEKAYELIKEILTN